MEKIAQRLGTVLDKLAYAIGPRLPGADHYRVIHRLQAPTLPRSSEGCTEERSSVTIAVPRGSGNRTAKDT